MISAVASAAAAAAAAASQLRGDTTQALVHYGYCIASLAHTLVTVIRSSVDAVFDSRIGTLKVVHSMKNITAYQL